VKVLVTGGNGEVGEPVVRRLAAEHRVRVADIAVPEPARRDANVEWMQCDLTDEAAAEAAVAGQDAVVHLAAIPNSFVERGPKILSVNVVSCYTVAEACRKAKVGKVIYAGSDSGLGFGIRRVAYKPAYLPIDGDHPCWPHESYSLSKYFGERIFEEYARAFRVPTLSIRLLYVLLDRRCRDEFLAALANRGREERADWMGGYVMPADVAEIIARGLDYDVAAARPDFPYEVFFAHAADTLNGLFTRRTTLEQAAALWGSAPPVKRAGYYDADPHAPFFDITPLRERLGYVPRFTFRDYRYYSA
jgi:nucleoside-diphosphate-sugar epimerase